MRSPFVVWVAVGGAVLALAGSGAAQPPAAPSPAPWTAACTARLERARAELVRVAPWAGRGSIELLPTTWPGWFLSYQTDDGRLFAMIEDYTTGPGPGWVPAGRGECFDESEPPPAVALVRNYAGRQAQIQITRAPRRARDALVAILRAALDDCSAL